MDLCFCTLFDSNYLDKGLVLYSSLQKVCAQYMLYILPMDAKCAEVLIDLALENVIVIDYDDFEDDDLKKLKRERGRAEFCWTCTAKIINYVLQKYKVDLCTYVDADLFFYRNPDIIVQELLNDNAAVQIVRHNFRKFEAKRREIKAGIYCVEFNTFINDDKALKVLKNWERDCVHDCSHGVNKEVFGDQKYLDNWTEQYNCINVCKNQGAGAAPWNVNKFVFSIDNTGGYRLQDKESTDEADLVFYHFQNLRYVSEKVVKCCFVNKENYEVVKKLYKDYLIQIQKVKQFLNKKYGINSIIKVHPANFARQTGKKSISNYIKKISDIGVFQFIKMGSLVVMTSVKGKFYNKDNIELIIELE